MQTLYHERVFIWLSNKINIMMLPALTPPTWSPPPLANHVKRVDGTLRHSLTTSSPASSQHPLCALICSTAAAQTKPQDIFRSRWNPSRPILPWAVFLASQSLHAKKLSHQNLTQGEIAMTTRHPWTCTELSCSCPASTPVLDCARPTRESSSDAESLEGTLLKAESKFRQVDAISQMRKSNGADLQETLVENKGLQKDPRPIAEDGYSMPNGDNIASRRSSRGARQRKKEPEADADEDVEPDMVEVYEKKSRARRKATKVDKQEEIEEEVTVVTTKTGQKRKVQVSKSSQSKKRKVTEEEVELVQAKVTVSTTEPWTTLVHKKPQPDWIVYNPATMRPEPPPSMTKTLKVMSWNVNGLRALMKDKDKKTQEGLLLTKLAMEEDFDVLCLQETKLQEKDVEKISKTLLSDYAHPSWSCSTSKLGYSGTAVISRIKPISVTEGMGIPDHDGEGRLITVEFDSFFLLTTYVPNSGEKLARLSYRTEEWDPALGRYIKDLEKQKPVILTGDLNCANEEIDIHSPDSNRKSAGFTAEERASFKAQFLNQGLVDTFRLQHPNAIGYTYWGYRSGARPKNQGWRLDYFLVSKSLAEQVHDSYVRPDVLGSDHCPIGIILKL